MGTTTFPLMYGVWHKEDKTWIMFTTNESDAHEMVRLYGDHLEVHIKNIIVLEESYIEGLRQRAKEYMKGRK